MSSRRLSSKTLLFSAVLVFAPPLSTEAQDVDVPGNLTMHDSTDSTVGNVLKEGVPFLHNFGTSNTFLGSGAGNFTMSGNSNTAIGVSADVPFGSNLSNATAIGAFAVVDPSNKIRLGNNEVTVIEGQVPYTYTSDRNEKENFRAVDADEALIRLRGLAVTSWNYKGQDAKQFRHYGPVAQDFFAAFGHDAVGTIGTPTTITSGDLDGILMVAAQALERRTVELKKQIDGLRVENANLKARLEALERRVGTEARARF